MSYTGQSIENQSMLGILFICIECGSEMEIFKLENTYKLEIVCPNCRHTKIFPIKPLSEEHFCDHDLEYCKKNRGTEKCVVAR